MRALGPTSPAARAVVAVAATSCFMVLVAWATLIGPDQVFTGPGPRPATDMTTAETCLPLPETPAPDGTVTYGVTDDINYRDLVQDHPAPWWVKVLIYAFLIALIVVVVGGVLGLLFLLVRAALSRRA